MHLPMPYRPLGSRPIPRTPLSASSALLQYVPQIGILAAIPGAAVIMSYACLNGFLPYLIQHVSTLQFLAASCGVAFVFLVGVAMGIASLLWLPLLGSFGHVRRLIDAIGTRFRRRTGRPAVRDARPRAPHPLLPTSAFERLIGTATSGCVFLSFVLLLSSNLLLPVDHAIVGLAACFAVAALILLGVVDLHRARRRIDWGVALGGLALAIITLVMSPRGFVSFLDQSMVVLGFRSSNTEIVLVDDQAHDTIEADATPYAVSPVACLMPLGNRTMWYLPRGVVVWRGPGEAVLIDPGQQGVRLLSLRPDQLVVLPKAGATVPCRRPS